MTSGVWHGDCMEILVELPDASIDAIVTDPPYGLGFMGSFDVIGIERGTEYLPLIEARINRAKGNA